MSEYDLHHFQIWPRKVKGKGLVVITLLSGKYESAENVQYKIYLIFSYIRDDNLAFNLDHDPEDRSKVK